MLKIRIALAAFIFLYAFNACKKENLPDAQGIRLKMTVSKTGDSIFYRSFIYDNLDRVISVYDSSNGWHRHRMFIDYDEHGRLWKVNESSNSNFDGSFAEISFSFSYDDKGRVIKKFGVSPTGSSIRNTYSYDSKNRLIADSIYNYWSDDIFRYITYSYDQNDNVIESKEIEMSSGLIQDRSQILYDQKPNPLNKQRLLFYFLTTDGFSLSSNNQILISYNGNTPSTFNYEYYANGLPKGYTEKSSYSRGGSMEFIYE